jgi:catechol 2,3-dioxygenase-like lactoylglutathione lyase family enzyme
VRRLWTIIGVEDVPASFRWYQSLFGHRPTAPAHPDFGQIVDSDGTVLLCLHEWDGEDSRGHASLMSPDDGKPGNGLLLFFRVDDFDAALKRARALVPRFEEDVHVNPNTGTEEFSLRDPDGYGDGQRPRTGSRACAEPARTSRRTASQRCHHSQTVSASPSAAPPGTPSIDAP